MRHPFAPLPVKQSSGIDKRRSTRIEAVVPIILSGRDSAGQPFRDETETLTVNLHGARIKTHRDLLVGMLVTIESVPTGAVAKAVCVRAIECELGTGIQHMAVRLVHPGNIWGIQNPPEDWGIAEKVQRHVQPAVPSPSANQVTSAEPEIMVEPGDLELQADQIVEAAAQRLRGLVEEILAVAFDEFQQRVDAAVGAAEARLNERSIESVTQLETTLKAFREDLGEDLDLCAAQAIASTEQTLRDQVPNILSSIFSANVKAPPTPAIQVKPEH